MKVEQKEIQATDRILFQAWLLLPRRKQDIKGKILGVVTSTAVIRDTSEGEGFTKSVGVVFMLIDLLNLKVNLPLNVTG